MYKYTGIVVRSNRWLNGRTHEPECKKIFENEDFIGRKNVLWWMNDEVIDDNIYLFIYIFYIKQLIDLLYIKYIERLWYFNDK